MENNKTDFFSKIAPLLVGGLNLTLTLTRKGDQITVATRPQRPDVKDKNDVLSKIQPLVITETAEALDGGYIETVTQAAEPVNSIADGLKEFNKGVDAAKAAASKKSAPKAKASTPAKAKTSKPKSSSKPKLSPEEAQAKKDKELAAKKASEIKALEQKLTSAESAFKANKFSAAEQAIAGGLKLLKTKKSAFAEGDTDYAQSFNEVSERVKSARAGKERAENMKKAAKPMSDARKLFTAMNMAASAKNLKAVYKLVPDHEEAKALTAEIIEKFGQVTYTQLMEM
jgi:PRTRC genetic system protein E